ncbi:hypothetical protein KOR42_41760 [Thalassoglobus neptunius]|uniref:Uncharacterized protein n=1 Tax=Thalassoglobus neptunius TaxID=1938619 RepID=A0A5C5W8X3_9PLAN|nr:hypothetical protein [Thalassoglobus neptunius]TWT47064.1 hypothetical protein KOR42_41760 [Thalassoglobus neptunius]
MRRTPLTKKRTPRRLAIAPADRTEVRYGNWHTSARGQFTCNTGRGRFSERLERTVELSDSESRPRVWRAYAMVPMVPADVRPTKGQLRDWFILWEVEEWYEKPKCMVPPTDPFLLKHVVGEFYAVLAEWDLTELEKAVMSELRNR